MADDQPLELEHVIGYSGKWKNSIHVLPSSTGEDTLLVSYVGKVVIISDLGDPHNQHFLRGHDEEITCLAVDSSGEYIASGQKAPPADREAHAPTIIWDAKERKANFKLMEVIGEVATLAFTTDSRFLASSGHTGIAIWEVTTGLMATFLRTEYLCDTLCWIGESGDNASNELAGPSKSYVLAGCYSANGQVRIHDLHYDRRVMQYCLSSTPCRLPTSGLKRAWGACVVDSTGRYLLCGSTVGDFCVFDVETKLFRTAVQAAGHAIQSMVVGHGAVYIAAADGTVKRYVGSDMTWKDDGDCQLAGEAMSVSLSTKSGFAIVGTSTGRVYRIAATDFGDIQSISESHVAPVTSLCFGERSDIFCTVSEDRTVRLWDLSDYLVLWRAVERDPISSCYYFQDRVYTGSPRLCCYDAKQGKLLWSVSNAHRGTTTAIRACEKCIITGGADGVIRVWSHSGEFLHQFTEQHSSAIAGLQIDVLRGNVVHSTGIDKSIFTFDLQSGRRIRVHMHDLCKFTSLSQRKDSEQELVTTGHDSQIMFWDPDEDQPVLIWKDPGRLRLRHCEVSHSGKYLVSCGDDQDVKVWELGTNELVAAHHVHSAGVASVAWTPDDKQIVSVGDDCCVCVWNFFGS